MTRDEQETERSLTRAEADWLRARGWVLASGGSLHMTGARWSHHQLGQNVDYKQRDALVLTRAEPLRFRRR